MSAVVAIADVVARSTASVCGRVVAVRIEPHDAAPSFGVQLDDGTGRIDALFMGRRAIPGIEPGARLRVEGMVCASYQLPRIFNPSYELLPPA